MRATKRVCAITTLGVAAVVLSVMPVGAASYNLTNPVSTGCVNKGASVVTSTTRTYLGVWSIDLRRSTGCNTVWAKVTRTDGKRCRTGGANCAQIKLTRVRPDGVTTATAWRKMPDGTNGVYSLQLVASSRAKFVGTATTFAGTKIGDTGTLTT